LTHDCDKTGRREFLQTTGCFMFTLTAALGLSTSAAAALPIYLVAGTGEAHELSYAIPPTDSVNIDRKVQVILVRFQNFIYAFALSCPHENAAVKWVQKDHRFQCTKHDSEYQPNGLHTAGRATRNMDRFAIRRQDANVVVDLTHWFQSDKNSSGWAAAAIQV